MTDTNKAKKGVKKSAVLGIVIAIVIVAAIFAGVILLLLHYDSAEVRTGKLVNRYYECIANDDGEGMERLFLDKDKAEIIKATESFAKYFDGIGKSLDAQYGAGYSIAIGNCEYVEFDNEVKKSYETAYEMTFSQAGLVNFDVTFSSAPSAKLDGGSESEIVKTFRDSLVVVKTDDGWFPAVSVGLSNGLSQKYFTALEVDDKRVTIAEYNFFYNMLSSNLGEGEKLSDSDAVSYVTEVYTMCAAAEKAGFKPAKEDVAQMEAQLAEIKEKASAFGDSQQKYYSAYYGFGMTEELLYDVYYAELVMQSYISKITEDTKPTDDEIKEYYDKNKNKFDTVDFLYYEIYSGVEGSLSDATDRATKILENSATADDFKAQCKNVYAGLTDAQKELDLYGEQVMLGEKYTYTDFQDSAYEFRDWLFSEARIEGDKKYFAVDSGDKDIGYIIVMAYMISPRSRADYNTVNFMYATVLTENVKEDEAVDRLTKAKDEWLSGEKTSESFGKIADKFYDSEDKNEDGGSYVLIAKGDMVDSIDKWIFDANRKQGDCEIVKSESGYHLLYFIGEDKPKWQLDVQSQMSYENVSKVYEDTSRELNIEVLSVNVVMYC